MTTRLLSIAAPTILLLAPAVARAHGLDAAAWLDPGGVRIVVSYLDGPPAAGISVLVFVRNESGASDDNFLGPPLIQDKLDREGKFIFMPDAPRDFLCVIEDGLGHRAEMEISGEELLVLPRHAPDATELAPEAFSRPIAVSSRPLSLNDVPLWIRIAAGALAIALVTTLFSRLLTSRRHHAP